MTVRLYKSTDASAPVLTGQAGSLVALLDAILVNGYGAKTAAGWTIAFTAANKRVYTMAAGGTGFSLYVDDSAAATAKEARMTGFEVPSALGTGTGQFPTSGQSSVGIGALLCRKSATADATARAWTCIADGHTFYLFIETGDLATSPFAALPFMFGDFFSYKSGEAYNCMIIGRTVENTALMSGDWFGALPPDGTGSASMSSTCSGHYVARSWTGIGGSTRVGKVIDTAKMGSGPSGWAGGQGTAATIFVNTKFGMGYNGNYLSGGSFPYPNGPDGGLYVSPIWLNHSNAVRGYLKGLWAPLHDRPLGHAALYSGTGNLLGKSFISQNIPVWIDSVNQNGEVHVEYSDTWS